jgi:1,4-dihydroxy-2-naphthoate octaprenyltransferase
MSPWISAFRPRTLPLALASILTGAFLAAATGHFNGPVVALAALTTILLQILSNLANDYGDSQNGADSVHREGPQRAVQSGAITPAQMKRGMWICGLLALGSGLALLWVAFGQTLGAAGLRLFLAFLALGLAAIWAAVNYTAGSNPYGYAGFGDISVFLFFGMVGVCGTYFLQTQTLPVQVLLPAAALGCFATAVLNAIQIWQRQESMQIDPLLKQMALSTLVFTVLFGVGQVLG